MVKGSIGQILIHQGVIDTGELSDALARQSRPHPVASELYTLGYASERQLCAALSAQTGWSAVVFDESTIRLDVLEHVTLEWARSVGALVIHEDATTLVFAASRPEDAIAAARELARARGKTVELRIALDVTLARTIRVAFKKWRAGELYLEGPDVDRDTPGLVYVQPDGGEDEHRQAQRALAEEAARNIESAEDLPSEELQLFGTAMIELPGDRPSTTITASRTAANDVLWAATETSTVEIAAELDKSGDHARDGGPPRALVVDPDPANRDHMVAELERVGYVCRAASTGTEATDLLLGPHFDIVFCDIATPEIDGLRLCRAIKKSRRLKACRVVVTTSVVDSGQIPDEVLQRHAVDGYLEKPLDARRLIRLLRDLSTEVRADHDGVTTEALGLYHAGDVDGAITRVRDALATDPASPKLHFMLANMLQRASRWAEAVDEYETVVELQPAYFPALTRLAYLYFRQGLHARAVETWRRALPVCEDRALRRNIELFMRKLVADMSKADTA